VASYTKRRRSVEHCSLIDGKGRQMKAALLMALSTLAAALGAAHAQVQAPTPSASQPARAASAPSPATAAERARLPGELRPEQPVVPQISVPLRREGATGAGDAASAPAPGGGVDDSAARCRAEKTKAARAACERRAY
jgi:hypothetical protein